ncbi:uncharacterized protein LOC130793969 isoform X1 [Actinidia eriantha]|uniref:uncharacterized protein LOC130793969 isoform X1 n=1 Tax=Actinidia eriantha TaxID=165200 RepID=UPI0025876135|nr:uncharacterized protein LOC130793969 isoform X1 [Actinidia eriantha]
MTGRKRLAGLDSIPDTNDSIFQSKRIMAGSPFDVHRAEPSQQQSVGTPPLDMRRAELSRQHVRALNTQFASWVQTQLQNHPDELWEDGARDYLGHASNIMEKFNDVVSWLKSNTANGESFSALGSHTAPKKFVSESKDNPIKSFQEKTDFAQAASNASFVPSWSSGGLFSSQTPFTFGSQSPAPLNHEASNDEDGEEELQQPSSPSVKKVEEKGVIVVHEVKCKLYVKSSDPADKIQWKEKGTGQLSIKCKEGISKGTRESKPTILVRNDVGKVLLNALIYPGIKMNMQKNSIVAIFHTTPDGGNDSGENNGVVARTFLIRTKAEEDRNKLAAAIQEYAPAV